MFKFKLSYNSFQMKISITVILKSIYLFVKSIPALFFINNHDFLKQIFWKIFISNRHRDFCREGEMQGYSLPSMVTFPHPWKLVPSCRSPIRTLVPHPIIFWRKIQILMYKYTYVSLWDHLEYMTINMQSMHFAYLLDKFVINMFLVLT